VQRDVSAALEFLSSEHGAEKFVLAGLCSGAYDAFQSAVVDTRVSAAVMLDIPGPFQTWRHVAYHFGSRVFKPQSWRNPLRTVTRVARAIARAQRKSERADSDTFFVQGVRPNAPHGEMQANLDKLAGRNVGLFFVFTAGLPDNYNHKSQFRNRFPRAAAHPAVKVEFLPRCDHTFSTRASREKITTLVRDFIMQLG
jgi:hypothetical protein